MTTTATAGTTASTRHRGATVGRPAWYAGLVVAVTAAWVVVALVHPMGSGEVYDDLRDQASLWFGVHVAQLFLSLGLGSLLWLTVRGLSSVAATVTRAAVPVYLVFFAAFDSTTGMASGLAVRHANSLDGPQRDGAASTADYLVTNLFTGDLSPIWAIASVALLTAVCGAAMALRSAGASRPAWGLVLGGVLLVMHAGPPAAVGLISLGAGLYLHDRSRSATRVAVT